MKEARGMRAVGLKSKEERRKREGWRDERKAYLNLLTAMTTKPRRTAKRKRPMLRCSSWRCKLVLLLPRSLRERGRGREGGREGRDGMRGTDMRAYPEGLETVSGCFGVHAFAEGGRREEGREGGREGGRDVPHALSNLS